MIVGRANRYAARLALFALVALLTPGATGAPRALATAPPASPAAADAAHALLPADWIAIRAAITGQLAALRSGDATRAFGFAAPGIRERFHDAPAFLRMVTQSYAALLAARYTEFLEGAVIEGHTIQPLRLIMNDDTVLVALYEMQRDASGTWRIAACVIAPSTVRST